MPWTIHEKHGWEGASDAVRFLQLAHERGLKATIRPGPACGAELPDHGYPRRVLELPGVPALRPNGIPYVLPTATHFIAVPSYASSAFLGEVGEWYAEVGRRLGPLQAPDGPIVACQVDNEMGYHFQAHPYAMDYHPEALAAFAEFCGGRWEPPRDGADEPEERRLAWMRFREEQLRRALGRLAQTLRASGLDRVPLFHNDYARTETPLDLGALERSGAVDIAGIDAYSGRRGSRWLADTFRHVTGSSKLPMVPELGAGWLTLPWIMPARSDPEDHEAVILIAAALGVRAINVYMLAERDRWYGSPLDRRGRPTAAAPAHRRVNAMLDELRLEERERDVRVLLVENRLQSLKAESRATLGELVPAFAGMFPFDFGLTTTREDLLGPFREVLWQAGCDYDRAASSSLPSLDKYEVILVPRLDDIEPEASAALAGCRARVFDQPEAAAPHLPEGGGPEVDLIRWTGLTAAIEHREGSVSFS